MKKSMIAWIIGVPIVMILVLALAHFLHSDTFDELTTYIQGAVSGILLTASLYTIVFSLKKKEMKNKK